MTRKGYVYNTCVYKLTRNLIFNCIIIRGFIVNKIKHTLYLCQSNLGFTQINMCKPLNNENERSYNVLNKLFIIYDICYIITLININIFNK